MDEIRQYCAQLYAEKALARDEAYTWLTQCKPFMQLVEVLRQHRFTIYQVARLVDAEARGPMSDLASELLAKLVVEHRECETPNPNPNENCETD